MMPFDITGVGIAAGISFAAIYTVVELIRHRDLEVINSAVVFLTIFAMVAGGNLIVVAMEGDPQNLPSSWREYLGASGVVGIGLSLQHLVNVLKKLLSAPASQAEPSEEANKKLQRTSR